MEFYSGEMLHGENNYRSVFGSRFTSWGEIGAQPHTSPF